MTTLVKRLVIPTFVVLLVLLSACTNADTQKTLMIDHPNGYEGVLVSGATSVIETSGYEEVLVSGGDKANELIDALNGSELVEASEEELESRTADLEAPGSYRMLLYNKPSVNSASEDIYPIFFYKDGTIQVNQEATPYFIADPPEDLLAKLKSDWAIAF